MTTGGIFGGVSLGHWGTALFRGLARTRAGQYRDLSFEPQIFAEIA